MSQILKLGNNYFRRKISGPAPHDVNSRIDNIDTATDRLKGVSKGHLEVIVGMKPYLHLRHAHQRLKGILNVLWEHGTITVRNIDVIKFCILKQTKQLLALFYGVGSVAHGIKRNLVPFFLYLIQ